MKTENLHKTSYLLHKEFEKDELKIISVSFKYSDITRVTKWLDIVFVNIAGEKLTNIKLLEAKGIHWSLNVFDIFKNMPISLSKYLPPLEQYVLTIPLYLDFIGINVTLSFVRNNKEVSVSFLAEEYPDADDYKSHGVYNLLEYYTKKIAIDFETLKNSLIFDKSVNTIFNSPELLKSTSPKRFEEIVGELFLKYGYDVEHIGKTGDGGVDLIAIENRNIVNTKLLIQCKRYRNKVGVAPVRELYGVKEDLGASKAVLVTTSEFTKGAKGFAEKNCWEMELIDYKKLLKLFKESID